MLQLISVTPKSFFQFVFISRCSSSFFTLFCLLVPLNLILLLSVFLFWAPAFCSGLFAACKLWTWQSGFWGVSPLHVCVQDTKIASLERNIRDLEDEIQMLKANGLLNTEDREEEIKQMEVYKNHSKFMKTKVDTICTMHVLQIQSCENMAEIYNWESTVQSTCRADLCREAGLSA